MSEHLAQNYEHGVGDVETVRVGSYVKLQLPDGEILALHLYEERPVGGELDDTYSAVSIDSPIGGAIVGHSVGEQIVYRTPVGAVTAVILSVSQRVD